MAKQPDDVRFSPRWVRRRFVRKSIGLPRAILIAIPLSLVALAVVVWIGPQIVQ